MRYDLHTHTTQSDGEKTPQELLELAKKEGLCGISITDHDTFSACVEAQKHAKELKLEFISGIEFSSKIGQESIHVLGYSFSLKNHVFKNFVGKCLRIREDRNLKIIQKFKEVGIEIDPQHLEKSFNIKMHQIGRPHFAKWLVTHGFCPSFQKAFEMYLNDQAPCFVLGDRPEVMEIIDELHKANALAILAHPHFFQNRKLIETLLGMPFDGLEGYYAKIHPDQEKKWIDIAKEKNWLITGGSDFHGDCKPLNKLGCSWVGDETFEKLKERFLENESLS